MKTIFVFGSNLGGIHGAGAAHFALQMGFPFRVGVGLYLFEVQPPQPYQGAYALPTKDEQLQTLNPHMLVSYINQFLNFAEYASDLKFHVTRVGCGLAGYKDKQVAPLFVKHTPNVEFDLKWSDWLGHNARYWGTFG